MSAEASAVESPSSVTTSGSILGRNGLRTVRHPNVLSFLHSTETETIEGGSSKLTIYVVTEPVSPLADKIKELNLKGIQRDEYYVWGLHQITKAISFLNNDAKLVHGNVCVDAVVVTPTLDWKLHAFDILSEFDGTNPAASGPMLIDEGEPKTLLEDPNSKFSGLVKVSGTETGEEDSLDIILG
ncbi:unnamed protein product [Calypogeia fissa]